MKDDLEDLRRRAGLSESMSNDQITQTFLEHVTPLRQLAELAYAFAQQEGTAMGHRRTLERIGIRANDLLIELTTFVGHQS